MLNAAQYDFMQECLDKVFYTRVRVEDGPGLTYQERERMKYSGFTQLFRIVLPPDIAFEFYYHGDYYLARICYDGAPGQEIVKIPVSTTDGNTDYFIGKLVKDFLKGRGSVIVDARPDSVLDFN